MSLSGLRLRTQVIQSLRRYLNHCGLEEIEVQLLASADTLEPTIYPFQVGAKYLSTSPEAFLKQAMAAGVNNCFAISHAFRNLEGQGKLHFPEFILAEWYHRHTDYRFQLQFTQDLVMSILPRLPQAWTTYSWRELWHHYLSVSLDDLLDQPSLVAFAQKLGLTTLNATWEQLFNQIADNYLVPHFPKDPFFLVDYPAQISPLAQPRLDLPHYAQRFELYINGIELANGNTESFHTTSIRRVMQLEQQQRGGRLHRPLLTALDRLNGQTWSGVGLGVDRLTMLLGKFNNIISVRAI